MKDVTWKRHCGVTALVRLFHTGICLVILMILLFKQTGLHWSLLELNNPVYGGFYVALVIISLCLYYTACLVDPGFVAVSPPSTRPETVSLHVQGSDTSDGHSDQEVEINMAECSVPLADSGQLVTKRNRYKYRYCDYCEIQPPLRAKHCVDCKLCVRRYDHHCPWLATCIGERNHRYFWWFLFVTSVLIVWTFVIVWESFITKKTWTEWFHSNIALFFVTVVLVLSGPVVAGLFIFHSYLVLSGLTTWEASSRERITYLKYLDDDYNPFDEGCLKNIYYFMCSRSVRKWESLYAQKARYKDTDS